MISVIGYENQNNIIYYQVQYGEKLLLKRFSQFEELHQSLLPFFPIPNLPPKSYVTVLIGKSAEQLEKRQKGLDVYLKELQKNPRIMKSYQIQSFLDQSTIVPMIHEFEGVTMPILDFSINFDLGLMFILGQKQKIVPSILNHNDQGCLECWIQKEEVFKKEWVHTFQKSPSCFHNQNNTVVIGFEDGTCFAILVNYDFDISSQKQLVQHSNKVLGIHLSNDRLHTISDDEYKVFSLHKNESILNHQLKDLNQLLVTQDRSFISDQNGAIFVFEITEMKVQALLIIETQVENLRGLCQSNNKLFCIGLQGTICIIETETYTICSKAKAKPQSSKIDCSEMRKQLFIGNKDGTLTAFDDQDFVPLYNIKAHTDNITRIINFENENLLLTSSNDKYIRAWRLPIQQINFQHSLQQI